MKHVGPGLTDRMRSVFEEAETRREMQRQVQRHYDLRGLRATDSNISWKRSKRQLTGIEIIRRHEQTYGPGNGPNAA